MDIWVVCDVYESEYDFSTHLTEKGALVDICGRILQWMGIYMCDNDSIQEEWKEKVDGQVLPDHPFGHNFEIAKWDEQDVTKLWAFYDFISEFTWEAHDTDFTISSTRVQA